MSLYTGDTLTVQAAVRNSSHPEVRFSSSHPAVVSVDAISGLITALGVGDATITAVSAIDPRIFAELVVTVLACACFAGAQRPQRDQPSAAKPPTQRPASHTHLVFLTLITRGW